MAAGVKLTCHGHMNAVCPNVRLKMLMKRTKINAIKKYI